METKYERISEDLVKLEDLQAEASPPLWEKQVRVNITLLTLQ